MSHFLDGGPGSPGPESQAIRIRYENWRGETKWRRVRFLPGTFRWTSTEWHPEPQWVCDGLDLDTGELRTFALAGISEWDYTPQPGDAAKEDQA